MAGKQKKQRQTNRGDFRLRDFDEDDINEDLQGQTGNNSFRVQQPLSPGESDSFNSQYSRDTQYSSDTEDSNEHVSNTDLNDEYPIGTDPSSDQSVYKRGRGETRVDDAWASEGKILKLELNERLEVVGDNAATFASQLGLIARDGNRLKLTIKDWRLVPQPRKEEVWKEVKGKTNLPDAYKTECLRRVSKLWRDWKSVVKTEFYLPYKHKKDLASRCPDRVEEDQWSELIKYWSKKSVKQRSKVNRRNRKKQTMPHRTGRKNFARLREELKKDIAEPSKLDIFLKSRQPKGTEAIDEATAKALDTMKDLKDKLPESEKNDTVAKDKIFHSILGPEKPGRSRCGAVRASRNEGSHLSFPVSVEWKKTIEDIVGESMKQWRDEIRAEMEGFREIKEQWMDQMMEKYEIRARGSSSDRMHGIRSVASAEPRSSTHQNPSSYSGDGACSNIDTGSKRPHHETDNMHEARMTKKRKEKNVSKGNQMSSE